MKRYIIGSGGFAKEVYFLLKEVYKNEICFYGFIDVANGKDSIYIGENRYEVINENTFDDTTDFKTENVELYFGIASPKLIQKIAQRFERFSFPNLIHGSFTGLTESIKMGVGNIITPGCIFTADVSIGSFNIFNTCTCLGHDTTIGSYNVFLPRTQVSGCVKIGDHNVFGMNASIIQGKKIGNNNSFGAYSYIIRSVQDDNSYFGIPAVKINF